MALIDIKMNLEKYPNIENTTIKKLVKQIEQDQENKEKAAQKAETEQQRRGSARFVVSQRHFLDEVFQKMLLVPLKHQRNCSLVRLDDFQLSIMPRFQPDGELLRVPDRRRQQQRPNSRGKKPKREFPDDSPFRVVKLMEFVHDDRVDIVEIQGGTLRRRAFGLKKPIEQNFRNDDQNLGVRIDFAVAGYQPDVVGVESPLNRFDLQFVEFLVSQSD